MKQLKIGLVMIVRNEAVIIKRCLESVKDFVDYRTIVDTGSTDDTIKTIEKTMCVVPAKLYKRKWLNFAHNHNQALKLAKGKSQYLLQMDADYDLVVRDELLKLTVDVYWLASKVHSTGGYHNSLRAIRIGIT